MNSPLVSIVITTKNEEKNIENCLKSILEQFYKNIEIIVVDNFSTDKTKEIVEKFIKLKSYKVKKRCKKTNFRNFKNFRTLKLYSHGPERSAQRNFGARKAKGEYYLYLDADMILSPDVIKECVEKFENCQLVGLYIPEIILGNSFWAKVRRFERSFYNATVIDCVRFIRMKDFLAVDGFDETMSGPEDWDFDKKIRNRGGVDIIKSVIYHNEGEFNLGRYLKKKVYYAESFDKYIVKWGKNDNDIKKQLGFYYRFFGVFIENGKWKKLIKHPILTFGMYFLRYLVGFNYLFKK